MKISILKNTIPKYDALIISSYAIRYSQQQNYSLNITKLMKLLYFIQAKYLVEKNSKCFNENILAWSFGPAIYEVFERYKLFMCLNPLIIEADDSIDNWTKKLIEFIVEKYADKGPIDLTIQTHSSGPWKDHWKEGSEYIWNEIPVEEIKEYYSSEIGRKEIS